MQLQLEVVTNTHTHPPPSAPNLTSHGLRMQQRLDPQLAHTRISCTKPATLGPLQLPLAMFPTHVLVVFWQPVGHVQIASAVSDGEEHVVAPVLDIHNLANNTQLQAGGTAEGRHTSLRHLPVS